MKKNWDQQAINLAFDSLIDHLELLLDQVKLSAFDVIMRPFPIIQTYLNLLKLIEEEVLVQWQLKNSKGLDALIKYQKSWYFAEIRKEKGLFTQWNQLCEQIWQFFPDSNIRTHNSLWKSVIHYLLCDKSRNETLAGLNPMEQSSIEKRCNESFKLLYDSDPFEMMINFLNIVEIGSGSRPEIHSLEHEEGKKEKIEIPKTMGPIIKYLEKENDWAELSTKLTKFWCHNSGGLLSHYPAFIVEKKLKADFSLRGIHPKEWTTFEQLIGIDSIRKRMVQNIDNFLSKQQGQHMLLWGGRGTGKSSSVLAILHQFKDQGLKLVEIHQKNLALVPAISEDLSKKQEHFLIFIDDLAFSEGDESYQNLKTVMEGSLLQTSNNILFVVTANRKDLVIHGDMDERYPEQRQLIDQQRAIDDRFGMKLFFEVPVYKHLQKILFYYADTTGIPYIQEDIITQFRYFAAINNHDQPSGRTVRQFITEWIETHS